METMGITHELISLILYPRFPNVRRTQPEGKSAPLILLSFLAVSEFGYSSFNALLENNGLAKSGNLITQFRQAEIDVEAAFKH